MRVRRAASSPIVVRYSVRRDGSATRPCPSNSANSRIVVSGVLNSCETFATNVVRRDASNACLRASRHSNAPPSAIAPTSPATTNPPSNINPPPVDSSGASGGRVPTTDHPGKRVSDKATRTTERPAALPTLILVR